MKIAILGGSFNPVHIGHLFLADSILAAFDYDRIILVPAFQSPFKNASEGAPARDRIEMLAASIPGDPRLTIDNCEVSREGVSYTIDTLKDIINRYQPEEKPGLILGDDLVSSFHEWRSHDEISELADIIIARRLQDQGTSLFPYPHKVLDNEILNVSSRQVRDKIKNREAWRYLVPAGARYVIEKRRLYGIQANPGRTVSFPEPREGELINTIVQLENEVRCTLNTDRFIHSRNTALMAWDLSLRFGLDCQKAYLAGITHDMCKYMKEDELIRLSVRDGGKISKLESRKPGLLHGRAAAVLLKRKYGIQDRDVLDAVRYHTTGMKDMVPLAKVIYIADKIEISRNNLDPALITMSRNANLDTLFRAVLDNTVAGLRARELDLSYGTRRLLAAMEKRSMP